VIFAYPFPAFPVIVSAQLFEGIASFPAFITALVKILLE
jgi:hypothetical protein